MCEGASAFGFCRAAICRGKLFRDHFAVVARRLSVSACENRRHERSVEARAAHQRIRPAHGTRTARAGRRRHFRRTQALTGRYCRRRAAGCRAPCARDLYEAQRDDPHGERWTYPVPRSVRGLRRLRDSGVRQAQASRDPQFYAIVDAADGRACGSCAYMRIEPRHGVIEVGNIYFAPRLAQHPRGHRGHVPADGAMPSRSAIAVTNGSATAATCRRAPRPRASASPTRACSARPSSTRAATATPPGSPSSIATGSAACSEAYLRWLDPENFDADGRQKLRLSELTAPFVERDSAEAWPPLPGPCGLRRGRL